MLHLLTLGISSKIDISSLYRLSSNVQTTEKGKSFRIENNFVACYLYVTFSSLCVLNHFFSYSGGFLKG